MAERLNGTTLSDLIHKIETNPYGRDKVMSLWQEKDLRETKGLNPCAFLTIWNVRGEYLDMMLVQRSGDMLTASGGGMVNEVQYAALLMMIARHTGYKPGVFTHFVANEQIYDRHINVANEIVRRYEEMSISKSLHLKPILQLNPNAKNFFEMTIDDFEMKHYNPMKPQLRLELGI
jgi:thymidylate synthase